MYEPELTIERSIDGLGRTKLTYLVKVTLTEPPEEFVVDLKGMNGIVAKEMKKMIEDQIIEDACLILSGGYEANMKVAGYNLHVHRSVPQEMVIMSPQAFDEFLKYADENVFGYADKERYIASAMKAIKEKTLIVPENTPGEELPE